jgi:long-chain acyl-CoA synthetase
METCFDFNQFRYLGFTQNSLSLIVKVKDIQNKNLQYKMKESHLAHIINNRVKKYGDKEVFRFKKDDNYESITWNQFKYKLDCVAEFLISEGIKTADNIGIYSPNCPEWTICDIAILSARAVVVPIYATSTYNQLEYISKETKMKIIFVGDEIQLINAIDALNKIDTLKKIITFNCEESDDERVICIEQIFKIEFDENVNSALNKKLSEAHIDDLATIIYTSGTTGEPKGVMLNHSNFIKSLEIHDIRLKLGEDDVSMAFLPLSHIFERAWTYFVLHSGAVNVYNISPRAIIDEMLIVRPTVMCAVPRLYEKTYEIIMQTAQTWSKPQKAIFDWALSVGLKYIEYEKDQLTPPKNIELKRKLANALVMKKLRKVFGGNIKYMPCAGAAMDTHILKFFHAMGLKINYGYGATETTATVSCMRTDKYDFVNTGSIMPEVEVKINETDGMILVKGETVFKGYYKKPEETAKTLIDGWYYSGDQGSISEEGTLLMTERIKDIIKTSTGKYISPQKIELILSQSDLIEQLCVIGDNRKYLTALIVPAYDRIRKLYHINGDDANDNKKLIQNPRVIEMMQKSLNEHQNILPPFEKIVKFKLLPEAFTIDNNLMTNSLKVRRKQVNTEYHKLIAEMY